MQKEKVLMCLLVLAFAMLVSSLSNFLVAYFFQVYVKILLKYICLTYDFAITVKKMKINVYYSSVKSGKIYR